MHSLNFESRRLFVCSGLVPQSQRDCVSQPKVALVGHGYLGFKFGNGNNANGVAAEVAGARERTGRNRFAVGYVWDGDPG